MSARPASAYRHDIRVTWGDCDPARIAYTGRLPWFTLDAINAWWEEHLGQGWYQLELDRNVGTPFVRLEMDFKAPVTPRHTLACHVWPSRLGTSSITFCVDGEQDSQICFSAQTVSVFIVADAFEKRQPPQDIQDLLAPFLRDAEQTGT
ncbi:acyl-CoA thioesterase [Ruegeria lacuscaerulensis]|uniref:acyl-CoA thioesterase n=1 Tax=Ruegeria lacuscaerulensis TaxID=55218 RepID=UPI0014819B52|nr:acyl-CoA thioesterase [Ruegeria lacuscaerulensis]